MISYHGSDGALTVVNGGTGNGIYLTEDRAIAEQYARLTAGRLNSNGTPTLLTITLADTAPDGQDHESILVWNTGILTITDTTTLATA